MAHSLMFTEDTLFFNMPFTFYLYLSHMSTPLRLREDKHCLNCGHHVEHTYCSHCGQPNIEPKLTLADLLHDFVHMLTHFDGKFFQTVRTLFARPGFLTQTYLEGKRKQFLPPVQMYVFTSALFFFIFYSFILKLPDAKMLDKEGGIGKKIDNSEFVINLSETDSALNNRLKTPEAYLRYQDSLPKAKRDGYFARLLKLNEFKLNKRIQEGGTNALSDLIHSFMKNMPKLLFISLPLLALFLKLLYFRRKNFTYVSHIVFLLHLYVFSFLALLLAYSFSGLNSLTNWSIFNWLATIVSFWIFYYGYKAMKNLYQQSRRKTLLKYALFIFAGMIITVLLFVGDVLFTIMMY